MNYKDRFTNKVVQSKKFSYENDMIAYINKNIDEIDIVQIYTSQRNCENIENTFHLLYKIKEKVMIW